MPPAEECRTMQNIRPYRKTSVRIKPPEWRAATILIAEDDAVYRAVFARELQTLGHRVICAENGASALELATKHDGPIEILVTDYFMPDFNGRELADRMVVVRPATRVLYMTGYMHRLVPVMSQFENCAGTIFAKPIVPKNIDEVIQALLDGRFKRPENS